MGIALWTSTPLCSFFHVTNCGNRGVGRHAASPSSGGAMYRLLICCFIVLVLSLSAAPQLPTSTLNVTVTDPQGAVVAAARIAVTTTATGTRPEPTTATTR